MYMYMYMYIYIYIYTHVCMHGTTGHSVETYQWRLKWVRKNG